LKGGAKRLTTGAEKIAFRPLCTLALALLMPGVGRANDVNDAAAPHNFAVFADLLH
jgi:hypothetical protein